jgi:hypothetical protein
MTIIEKIVSIIYLSYFQTTSFTSHQFFRLTHTLIYIYIYIHLYLYSRHITGTSFGSGGSGGRKRLQSLAKPYSSKPDEINSWSSFKEHMKLGFEMQNIYYVRDDIDVEEKRKRDMHT